MRRGSRSSSVRAATYARARRHAITQVEQARSVLASHTSSKNLKRDLGRAFS